MLNQTRVKPAKDVHLDDIIEIRVATTVFTVRVRLISDIRGPAGVAQTLYAETEASLLAREAARERVRLAPEPALRRHGRPTKRDRRQLDRVSGEFEPSS